MICCQDLSGQQSASSQAPGDYFQLGTAYFRQAKYDSALAVLALARQAYTQQADKPGQIECLLQQGRILAEMGQLTQAEETLLQAKNMSETLSEDTSRIHAEVLETAGELYYHKQLFVQAAENFDGALARKKALLGEVHAEIAGIYRKKSLIAFAMNNLPEAFRLAEQSRKILEQLPAADTTLWADYYLTSGSFYDRMGQHEEARRHYERSLQINLNARGEMHPQTGRAYLNLSNILRIRENPLHARTYAEKALSIFERAYGKRHIMVGSVNNSLAILDADLGDQAKAIVYYQNALDIISEKLGAQSMQVAFLLNNLGIAFGNSGQHEKALEFLEQSLEIRKKYVPENSVPIAVVYLNMGDELMEMNQLEEALSYNQKAALVFEQAGYAIGLAPGYRGIAEVQFARKNYTEALEYFRKSALLHSEFSGENYVDLGQNYNQMAETFLALHQTDSALFYYQAALKVLIPGFEPADAFEHPISFEHTNSWQHTITAMAGKAHTCASMYQTDTVTKSQYLQQAFDTYIVVSELIDLARSSYRQDASRLYLSGLVKPVYQNAIEVAYQLFRQQPENRTYLEAAFAFAEKSKYALLSDFMRKSVVKASAGVPDSVLQQEETVKNEVAVLEQTLLDAQQKLSADTIQVLENSLTDAKKRHLDFLARLEQKYPDYFSLIYGAKVAGIDDIQQKLLEDNILLEYALTDEAVFLFVISPDNAHFLRFNKKSQLNDRIVSLRSALLQKDYQRYVETAHSLYQQLMQQAEGEMAAVKKMIVVPDGMLALLPFEILLTDTVANISEDYSALPYLLHKHQICYNYSATVALATKAKKSNAARIEVLGFAPDFTSSGGQDFIIASTAYEDTIRGALVPLEGAEAELSSLSGLFDGSYFFRQEATEENFKRMAAHSRIIHLATHAVADDNDPMYSRLYFTRADTLQEDGILHTYELYNLKLNAALVTLSACNTGLGKIQQGEGIVSLASGFAYAGCPNIVMSLWPASDKATARLMEIFYQGLSEGLPKDEALYQAKLQYLSSADPLSANPYFWGSFVFVGDPVPLKATMPIRMVVAIMAGIILVISGLVYFVRNRR